jgi:hypothetical protein
MQFEAFDALMVHAVFEKRGTRLQSATENDAVCNQAQSDFSLYNRKFKHTQIFHLSLYIISQHGAATTAAVTISSYGTVCGPSN